MNLLSWNIQWCRGIDGVVDPQRIARRARDTGDPDLICLQEVAIGCDALAGSRGEDQVTALAAAFPEHSAHFAAGLDTLAGGRRRQFGNLILSRRPVRRVFRHALPWPPEAGVPSMPRVALEVEVEVPWGLLRLVTTHLEYYAATQRDAQIERLRALHVEACAHADAPLAPAGSSVVFEPLARPREQILTGDFNLPAGSAQHARLLAAFEDGVPRWLDAWRVVHGEKPHAPSFRLHDTPAKHDPLCCDFILLTEALAPRLRALAIDGACRDSDHQPVLAQFED